MLAAILLALPLFVAAQDPPAPTPAQADPRAEFTTALDSVYALLRSRNWKAVQKKLGEVLTRFEGNDAARGKLLELEDLARMTAFWSSHPEPNPKTLVFGNLEQLDRGTDLVRISYESGKEYSKRLQKPLRKVKTIPALESSGKQSPPSFPDFEVHGDYQLHPLQFTGPYKAEIRGFVGPQDASGPVVLVYFDDDEYLLAGFGEWATLTRIAGGESEVLAREAPSGIEAGKEFKIDVAVAESTVTFRSNGQIVLKGPKPRGKYGRFGYSVSRKLKGVEISGKSDGQWIDALVDAAVAEDRAAFDKAFDARKALPAWLFDVPNKATRDEAGEQAAKDLVASVKSAKFAAKVEELIAAGRWRGLSQTLEAAPEADIDAAARAWLLTRCYAALSRPEDALVEVRKVCAAAPKHREARMAAAALAARVEPNETVIDVARALVRDFPDEPLARQLLVRVLIRAKRLDEALREAEGALAAGVERDAVAQLLKSARRAVAGPIWRTSIRQDSDHYTVVTDMDRAAATQISRTLEETYQYLRREIGPISDGRPRMRVFVFAGREAYLDYAEDLLGVEKSNTAGLFVSVLSQLLFYNANDRDEFVATARHEALHQYVDELVPELPIWLHEGLAQYFEYATKEKGRLVAGQVPSDKKAVLAALEATGKWPTLERLFALEADEMQGQAAGIWYSVSWGVIHALARGAPEDRRLFDGLVARIARGVDGRSAVRETFEGIDLDALLVRIREHAASL